MTVEATSEPDAATEFSEEDDAGEIGRSSSTITRARDKDWAPLYLAALALNGGCKEDAAKEADVGLRRVQRARKRNPEFAAAEMEALEVAGDRLESVITRRAINGDVKVIVRKDGSTVEVVEYDSYLQIRLAERRERGTWSQRQQVEHSVGASTFGTASERRMSLDDARKELAATPLSLNKAGEVIEIEATEQTPEVAKPSI